MDLDFALNLLENNKIEKNTEKVSVTKNSFLKTKNFTEEQERIIEAKESEIKIKAYAGTGKTFVLENFSRNIKKGLYIAFNKDMKLEAEKRFPKQVKCMTIHGMAFGKFGVNLQHKINNIFPDQIYELNIQSPDSIRDVYAKTILNTVMNFTYSKDLMIDKTHIDLTELQILIKASQDSEIKNIRIEKIIQDAQLVWKNMIDSKSAFPTTHDTYLKLMQLANPQLPYETILLDEAQDTNPAMLDIFEKQKCRKVMAGDPYQSIYGFRKSIDAMQIAMKGNYTLSKSFRFGQLIADCANTLISLRGETTPVFGNGAEAFVGLLPQDVSYYPNKAVITRTNAKIFEEAVKYAEQGYSIYLEGGEQIAKFDLLEDLQAMYSGYMPRDGFLKGFFNTFNKNGKKAFEALKEFSKENKISDWSLRCNLVDKYQSNLSTTINSLRKSLVSTKQDKTMIITNVHKSKGLEYDTVIISDDFNLEQTLIASELLGEFDEKDVENINLLYVAITRAKHNLFVSEELMVHLNNINYYLKDRYILDDLTSVVKNKFNIKQNLHLLSKDYIRTLDQMKLKLK